MEADSKLRWDSQCNRFICDLFSTRRVIVYTAYMDDEKKQVLQLFGQRSGDITRGQNCVLCDLPNDLENPALLVTGQLLFLTIWRLH